MSIADTDRKGSYLTVCEHLPSRAHPTGGVRLTLCGHSFFIRNGAEGPRGESGAATAVNATSGIVILATDVIGATFVVPGDTMTAQPVNIPLAITVDVPTTVALTASFNLRSAGVANFVFSLLNSLGATLDQWTVVSAVGYQAAFASTSWTTSFVQGTGTDTYTYVAQVFANNGTAIGANVMPSYAGANNIVAVLSPAPI